MKNTVTLSFFGAAVLVSSLFVKERKLPFQPTEFSSVIISKEAEKKILIDEVNYLMVKNATAMDSIKNQ